MIKGDRIKLIKKMGAFNNIGEICEIIDIQEGGVIYFKFGGCHLGCMSYDEYEKYFEKVEIPVKKPWGHMNLLLWILRVMKRPLNISIEIMVRESRLEVVF